MISYIPQKNSNNAPRKILITKLHGAPYDGVFSYLYGVLSHADLSSTQVDLYASDGDIESTFIFPQLMELGINVFVGSTTTSKPSYLMDKKNLDFLMRKTAYDALYVNTGSLFFSALHLTVGTKYGIKKRITHSHNSLDTQRGKPNAIKKIFHFFARGAIRLSATDFIACSEKAGDSLFGRRTMTKKGVVIKNGIDVGKYAFDSEARSRIRQKLGIDNASCVLGLSAYFIPQKNHAFLIKVFTEFVKERPNARLLLLGDGAGKEAAVSLVKSLGVYENCIFLGSVANANEYYSAMDVFVMPSIHEGLPFVGIEAQAACLPCLFSDAITQEVGITEYAHFFSLNEPAEEWVRKILLLVENSSAEERIANTANTHQSIKEHGYDLLESISYITSLLDLNGGHNA